MAEDQGTKAPDPGNADSTDSLTMGQAIAQEAQTIGQVETGDAPLSSADLVRLGDEIGQLLEQSVGQAGQYFGFEVADETVLGPSPIVAAYSTWAAYAAVTRLIDGERPVQWVHPGQEQQPSAHVED